MINWCQISLRFTYIVLHGFKVGSFYFDLPNIDFAFLDFLLTFYTVKALGLKLEIFQFMLNQTQMQWSSYHHA